MYISDTSYELVILSAGNMPEAIVRGVLAAADQALYDAKNCIHRFARRSEPFC